MILAYICLGVIYLSIILMFTGYLVTIRHWPTVYDIISILLWPIFIPIEFGILIREEQNDHDMG